ncbi:TIR domain-containing protein [Parasphingopyxis lamellibrachiae]|uniref:TIR domain-containing protein n=1 Tax=Parasphingopyxis lamellibrachiae TaxID=680125 RepID=A0A3D9FIU0_9SPHN|nr:TIR domain-containing protein [Parasphingopyxis lamellibrachiae]RED17709.1 TIR domain-containing protein [Parasphingopyxis lamellibrachiae]
MSDGQSDNAGRPTAFISHHSSQVETARRLKVILGHHGVTGWMAPDDIDPGQPFDKAIVDQVRQSDLIILLFCGQSDQSRHVKRELMMAEDSDKLIYPVRLEEKPADGLAYWLNDYQWIDWFDGDDKTITRMIDTIKRQAKNAAPDPAPPPVTAQTAQPAAAPPPPAEPAAAAAAPVNGGSANGGPGNQWKIPIVTALIVAAVMLAGFYIMTRDDGTETAAADTTTDPALDDGRTSVQEVESVEPQPIAPVPQQPEPQYAEPAPSPTPPASAVPATGGGYYVVVGSFQPGDRTALRRARGFQACAGIEPIVARSDDYPGLAPGLTVVMIGSYPDAAAANRALGLAQPCVADAYVRTVGG